MNASVVNTMLRALLRWWWLIALAVSLGVGVGYLLRSEQVDLYSATATASVDENSPNLVRSGFVDSLSTPMLQPVIDDLQLDLSVDELINRMTLDTNTSALLLKISIVDTDPDRAAAIANRIVDELINQTSDRSALLDREFITKQINDIQRQITEQQAKFDQLVKDAETLTSAYDLSQNLDERSKIESTIQDLRNVLLDLVANAPKTEVKFFEAAVPNYYPISSNGFEDLIIAGAAGGILSILTIVLFTFFDDRLQWDEGKQDTTLFGLKILGPLGIIPGHKLPLYVDTMPQSVETEAIRQVRAKLTLAAGGEYPHILTILSYDSGEGKTMTSANLALEVSRSGLHTLLIDGDLRRSDLHEVFQLPNVYGLSDILQRRDSFHDLLPEALLDSGYENLSLLPAGRSAADPGALLSQPRFRDLMDLLGNRYQAIIIDSAPTIGGPDAVFLGEVSDGVVIVVNARRTRLSSLRRSVEELRSGLNVNIYGIVFNRVRLQVTSKYNNYYYHQTPKLSPERLSSEMAKSGAGLFAMHRHIIADRNGEKLFSVEATAARLGVKKRTIRGWIDSGYIHSEHRFMRQWIREESIDAVMQQRTTAAPPPPTEQPTPADTSESASAVNGNHEIPAQLREQREAILGFVNRPNRADPEV